MAHLDVVLLPGDGVGPEVTHAAVRVLEHVAERGGHILNTTSHAIGWDALEADGSTLPRSTLDACLDSKAVLLGAVGDPRADHLPPSERPVAALLRLRQVLGCFANLRPLRVPPGLVPYSALRPERVSGTDLLIVRELSGGLYYGEPRELDEARGTATNTVTTDRAEVLRVARLAFELAGERNSKVTSVDKANVIEVSRLWRSVLDEVAPEWPGVEFEHMLVDRAAMELASAPTQFDVLVMENLFGDILSDEVGALGGSLGVLGSASLGGDTGLYEPVHGSAPDIAGAGVANPVGALVSVAMMLRHTFDLPEEAAAIEAAIDAVWADGVRTADLRDAADEPRGPTGGGVLGTMAFADAVLEKLRAHT